jgi:peptide/nickel transport system permease protein
LQSSALVSRMLQFVVVLFGVTLLVFSLVRVVPGDPVKLLLGDQATEEQIRETRAAYGLDRPLLLQYAYYVRDLFRGDFGDSLRQKQPVVKLILEALPATLQLAAVSITLSIAVGVPLGVITALRKGSVLDSSLMTLSLIGQAMPTFWWGIVLITVFAVAFRLLPTSGTGSVQQLILPAVSLATYITSLIVRLTRSAMIEVLGQDYIRTAKAKGLAPQRILFTHALKNASIPIATVIGLQFGNLLGGAVIVETVFAWPGIGLLALNAINNRDYPLLQAIVLLSAVVFLAINMLIDFLYVYLDPRIRYR